MPDHKKHPNENEAAHRDFGKRNLPQPPAPWPTKPPSATSKRSSAVLLLALGGGALGLMAWAGGNRCQFDTANRNCNHSSGGGGGSVSGSAGSSKGTVTRGGFGSFGSAHGFGSFG